MCEVATLAYVLVSRYIIYTVQNTLKFTQLRLRQQLLLSRRPLPLQVKMVVKWSHTHTQSKHMFFRSQIYSAPPTTTTAAPVPTTTTTPGQNDCEMKTTHTCARTCTPNNVSPCSQISSAPTTATTALPATPPTTQGQHGCEMYSHMNTVRKHVFSVLKFP